MRYLHYRLEQQARVECADNDSRSDERERGSTTSLQPRASLMELRAAGVAIEGDGLSNVSGGTVLAEGRSR